MIWRTACNPVIGATTASAKKCLSLDRANTSNSAHRVQPTNRRFHTLLSEASKAASTRRAARLGEGSLGPG